MAPSAAFQSLDEDVKCDIAMILAMETYGGIDENANRQSVLARPRLGPSHPLVEQIERISTDRWSRVYRTYNLGHILSITEEWSGAPIYKGIPASMLWVIAGFVRISHQHSAAFFSIADRLITAAGVVLLLNFFHHIY